MSSERGLYWIFTINNYSDDELITIRNLVASNEPVSFICFGLEIGPENGLPHVQGYLQCSKRMRTAGVCLALGGRARVEIAKGSLEDNRKYCSKTRDEDETPNEVYEEYGDPREPGRKKRKGSAEDAFVCIVEEIDNGATLVEICNTYPMEFIKFHGGIEKMFKLKKRKYQITPNGPFFWEIPFNFDRSYLIYGASGIGKTTYVLSRFPKALMVTHIDDLKAFGSGEYDTIVFDDMSFTHLPDRAQLSLVDTGFDRSIHVRYGTVFIPAGTPKIFLHNRKNEIFNLSLPEIRRRVHIVRMTDREYFFE